MRMGRIVCGLAVLALAATGVSAPAARAPRVSIASINDLPQPLPLPYDAQADADTLVAQAKARAKAKGKKLLIDLGGNWCADCRILAGIFELPEVKAFLGKHYELVSIDIGRFDRNGQVPMHYGVNRLAAVPALLIIDPRTDKLLNAEKLFALEDARHMTPQALADWLAQWV